MKNQSTPKPGKPGYISYVLVISTSVVLTLITFFAFKRAVDSKEIQADVQLKVDYTEKEDAILRAIIAMTPNRAMRAMKVTTDDSWANRRSLRWRNIFNEALDLANARSSISTEMMGKMSAKKMVVANVGDSQIGNANDVFHAISGNNQFRNAFISSGINRSLGQGFPPPLQTSNSTITTDDRNYPLISYEKKYGDLADSSLGLASSNYPDFNLIPYPEINFGYASPGELFVAKRNWWAFELDLANADSSTTNFYRPKRQFVLSIYEIPSQLAISASSFMSLGKYGSGAEWGSTVNIEGNIFAGKARVEGSVALDSLASRRSMELSSFSTIGGESFVNNPFTPGVREDYQITKGEFFPVSLASESGRVSFVPINRGVDFFDRFAHVDEGDTISPTSWNEYTVGALQCAMTLDIVEVDQFTKEPTRLRFQAKPLPAITYDVADLANSKTIPFRTTQVATAGSRLGVEILPERFPAFLQTLGASDTTVNHSLVVNVDYTTTGLNNPDFNPIGTDGNYRNDLDNYVLVIRECGDLTAFTKGFSLVSNLRTYIGDDFNNVAATPPSDYDEAVYGEYYPPVSMFVPEKRFGVEEDPYQVTLSGQIGSLASENAAEPIRPLDTKTVTEREMDGAQVEVNLKPIAHPAALPPITMMNWLIMIEELRPEHMN